MAKLSCAMDQRLRLARNVVTAAALVLVPTAALSAGSRVALALAVAEAAVLAIVTGYAVYLGIYRYPR